MADPQVTEADREAARRYLGSSCSCSGCVESNDCWALCREACTEHGTYSAAQRECMALAFARHREAERERCALLAEAKIDCNDSAHDDRWCKTCDDYSDHGDAVATAIRQNGKEE